MKRFLSSLAAGALPIALTAALLFSCSGTFGELFSTTTEVVQEGCEYAPALAQSPAIQLEAERLGVDVAVLVDLICQSAALLDAWQSAQILRAADPGAAVVVRLRSAR